MLYARTIAFSRIRSETGGFQERIADVRTPGLYDGSPGLQDGSPALHDGRRSRSGAAVAGQASGHKSQGTNLSKDSSPLQRKSRGFQIGRRSNTGTTYSLWSRIPGVLRPHRTKSHLAFVWRQQENTAQRHRYSTRTTPGLEIEIRQTQTITSWNHEQHGRKPL